MLEVFSARRLGAYPETADADAARDAVIAGLKRKEAYAKKKTEPGVLIQPDAGPLTGFKLFDELGLCRRLSPGTTHIDIWTGDGGKKEEKAER